MCCQIGKQNLNYLDFFAHPLQKRLNLIIFQNLIKNPANSAFGLGLGLQINPRFLWRSVHSMIAPAKHTCTLKFQTGGRNLQALEENPEILMFFVGKYSCQVPVDLLQCQLISARNWPRPKFDKDNMFTIDTSCDGPLHCSCFIFICIFTLCVNFTALLLSSF
jgi:hypothetical protein